MTNKSYFVGGHPEDYLDLPLRMFCYSTWSEDISTAPAPIEYGLGKIEHAVSSVVRADDPTSKKAGCVAAAVQRHIRNQHSPPKPPAATAGKEVPTCQSSGGSAPVPVPTLLAALCCGIFTAAASMLL